MLPFSKNLNSFVIPLDDVTFIEPLHCVETGENCSMSEDADLYIVASECLNDQIARTDVRQELIRPVTLQRIRESAIRSHYSSDNFGVTFLQRRHPLVAHSS